MHSSAAVLPPLSIELGTDDSKPYKSIQRIAWNDIPPFAVVTGPNGSGKTQFLQALAYKLSYPSPQLHMQFFISMPLKLVGTEIGPHEVAYLPSAANAFRIGYLSISNLTQAKFQFLQNLAHTENNIEAQILRERVRHTFGIHNFSQQPAQEMMEKLPDDFTFMLEYGDVSAALSHLFVGYQVRLAEKLLAQEPEENILKELGQPPWEIVNGALESADFGHSRSVGAK